MSRNIKLTIEYDGTAFNGWQVQPNNQRTVQGIIEKAVQKIFNKKIRVIGSGRTDSGVHALGQVANFKVKSDLPLIKIRGALNANLPVDVVILKVEEVPLDFHARYSVKAKTYRYTVLYRKTRCARQRHFCLLYPYPLNLSHMRQEAKILVGRHDFKSFQAVDAAKPKRGENTVRTIKRLEIKKKGDYIYIDIEANGFLYKMVRNIVGTLLEIGTRKLPKGSMKNILSKKDRTAAGPTAKSHGLALVEVKY